MPCVFYFLFKFFHRNCLCMLFLAQVCIIYICMLDIFHTDRLCSPKCTKNIVLKYSTYQEIEFVSSKVNPKYQIEIVHIIIGSGISFKQRMDIFFLFNGQA